MRSLKIPTALLGLALLAAGLTSCGKKGTLLPPLSKVPSPPSDVALTQRGRTVIITWQNPTTFVDGYDLPGLSAVEVWLSQDALETGKPAPKIPTADEYASKAALLVRVMSDEFPGEVTDKPAPKAKEAVPQSKEAQGRTGKKAKAKTPAALALKYEYVLTADKPDQTRLTFGLRAVDKKGRPSEYSSLATFTPKILPSPATELQGTVKSDSLELRWLGPAENIDKSKPPQIKGYNVYRSVDGAPAVRLNTELVTGTETTDKTFEFGRDFVYTVRAATQNKDPFWESDDSAAFRVRPEDVFAPSAPSGLTTVVGPDFISLTWDPNPEKDLAGYRVWRREQGGTEFKELTTVPLKETTFQDATAARGQRYEYAVTAEDVNGNRSEYSKTASEQRKEGRP